MGFKRFLTMLVVMLSLLCFSNSVMAKEDLNNLFTDYTHTEVNKEWTLERITNEYKELDENDPNMIDIKRALSVLSGAVEEKNEKHERSTSDETIEKTGDIRSHMHDELKLRAFSTNSQPTGLNAKTGSTIKVFAENIPEGQKISINFEQILSNHSGVNPFPGSYIHNGENSIKVPYFNLNAPSGYKTVKTIARPMIYVSCPYDETNLTKDISLYFEGVESHPVFHMDKDDPESFKQELRNYSDEVRNNPNNVLDAAELVSNHTIMVVRATRADELLSQSNYDVVRSLKTYDDLVEFMYKFDGIDDTNDKLAQNAKEYFTLVQEGHGEMYTGAQYIGVHAGSAEDTIIDCYGGGTKSNIGWGLVHELGHAFDNESRVRHESTNNVFTNAYFTWVKKEPNDGTVDASNKRNSGFLEKVREIPNPGFVKGSIWSEGNDGYQNYLVFTLLESYHPGYWADVDNYYRNPENEEELAQFSNDSEKMVYVSSKVLNIDLGYWFEDFGLQLAYSRSPFIKSGASSYYKQKMNELCSQDGFIAEEEVPFWFLDIKQYLLAYENHNNPDWGNLYSDPQNKALSEPFFVKGRNSKYQIVMTDSQDEQRLLYEVYVKNGEEYQSLGQTYDGVFTLDNSIDPNSSEIYVRALDRKLNWSDYTEVKQKDSSPVARIGTQTYSTLSEAFKAALENDSNEVTITITKDTVLDHPPNEFGTDDSINIRNGKNITLRAANNITIYQLDSNYFRIDGASLTVDGNIVFKGLKGVNSTNALFYLENGGNLTLNNVQVYNWHTSSCGSVVNTGSSSGGRVNLDSCKFVNCGGGGVVTAICNSAANNETATPINIEDCEFTNCYTESSYDGAAIRNENGNISATGCSFTDCSSQDGGAVWSSGDTKLTNCKFIDCRATNAGGAIYVSSHSYDHSKSGSELKATGSTTVDGGTFNNCDSSNGTIITVSGNNITGSNAEGQTWLTLKDVAINNSGNVSNGLADLLSLSETSSKENVLISSIGNTELKGTTSFNGNIKLTGGKLKANSDWYISQLNLVLDSQTPGEQLILCEQSQFDGIKRNTRITSELPIGYVNEDGAIELAKTDEHKIEYDLNNGEWTGEYAQSYQEGYKTKLPDSTKIKKGKESFVGWFKEADFSGSSVKEVGLPEDKDNLKFYAKWAGEDLVECQHEWTAVDKITVEADCAHVGYKSKTLTCSHCHQVKVEEETTPKTDHKYGNPEVKVVDATCTQSGTKTTTKTCSICHNQQVSTETLQSLGHNWGDWSTTKQPTATASGSKTRKCNRCGKTETESIKPTGQQEQGGGGDTVTPPPSSGGGSSSSGGSGGSGNNNPPGPGGGGNTPSVSPGSDSGGGSGSMPVTPPSSDSDNSNDNKDVAVTGVTVTPSSGTIEIGETLQLRATVTPNNATDKTVTWSSKDSTIASVNQAGLVTAKAAGTTKITVTTKNSNKTAVCSMTVKAKESSDSPSTKPETPSQPVQPSQPNQPVQPSQPNQPAPQQSMPIYRLYNAANNEHLYTSDAYEVSVLAASGWTDEGVGWSAPATGEPVYRLYSPVTNEHHYTKDTNEVSVLKNSGWSVDNGEKPLFYSGGSKPVYRLYHEGTQRHHLTTDESEYNILGNGGWNQEGIALQSLS